MHGVPVFTEAAAHDEEEDETMPLVAAHELEHVRVAVPYKYISWSLPKVTELESSEAST